MKEIKTYGDLAQHLLAIHSDMNGVVILSLFNDVNYRNRMFNEILEKYGSEKADKAMKMYCMLEHTANEIAGWTNKNTGFREWEYVSKLIVELNEKRAELDKELEECNIQ